LRTVEQKRALIKAMFDIHDELADACASNFEEIGTLTILNYVASLKD
jgi:hypothetical protein